MGKIFKDEEKPNIGDSPQSILSRLFISKELPTPTPETLKQITHAMERYAHNKQMQYPSINYVTCEMCEYLERDYQMSDLPSYQIGQIGRCRKETSMALNLKVKRTDGCNRFQSMEQHAPIKEVEGSHYKDEFQFLKQEIIKIMDECIENNRMVLKRSFFANLLEEIKYLDKMDTENVEVSYVRFNKRYFL